MECLEVSFDADISHLFCGEQSQPAIRSITFGQSSWRLPRIAHSQIIKVRHPACSSFVKFFSSFAQLRVIFFRHNSELALGHLNSSHSCLCQKQPCTKMTALYFGNTR